MKPYKTSHEDNKDIILSRQVLGAIQMIMFMI